MVTLTTLLLMWELKFLIINFAHVQQCCQCDHRLKEKSYEPDSIINYYVIKRVTKIWRFIQPTHNHHQPMRQTIVSFHKLNLLERNSVLVFPALSGLRKETAPGIGNHQQCPESLHTEQRVTYTLCCQIHCVNMSLDKNVETNLKATFWFASR